MNKKYNQLKPLRILMATLLIQSSILPNFVSIVSAQENLNTSIETKSSSEVKDSPAEDITNNTEDRTIEKDTIPNVQSNTKENESSDKNTEKKENPEINNSSIENAKEKQDKESRATSSGTWGTCEWKIDENGTLAIGGGTLANTNSLNRPSWYAERDRITRVTFRSYTYTSESATSLFAGLSKVTSIDNFDFLDTRGTTDMTSMFYGMSSLTSLDLSIFFDTSKVTSMTSMFYGMSSLTSLDLGNHFDTSKVTRMTSMFYGMSSLTSLDLGDHFDTSKVTNMYRMFYGMSSLTSLDLGDKFDTSNVTDMSSMFYGMSSLPSLDLGDKFDTSNVPDMSSMFYRMSSLTSLDLGDKFDTSKVIDMSTMFYDMTSLPSLDLGDKFDTSNVTNMSSMFQSMRSLASLDLGDKFDTSKVTNMSLMFGYLYNLPSLDLGDKFDTSKVTYMASMFNGLSSLPSLDLGDKFDTSNVTDMSTMFYGMSSLTSLDLGDKFDTSNVTSVRSMFADMGGLRRLNLGDKFVTNIEVDMTSFLSNASKLSQLTLSKGFRFYIPSLPEIKDENYTGKWVEVGSGTVENPNGQVFNGSSYLQANVGTIGYPSKGTYVWQKKDMEVKTRDGKTVLGMNSSLIDPSSFIESVTIGGNPRSKDEYNVEFLSVDTSSLGKKEVKLRVSLVGYEGFYEDVSATLDVQWGSTLVVEDNGQKAVDASVSLIDNNGSPSLNANQGFGTLNPFLTSRPDFKVFRGDTTQKVVDPGVGVVTESPQELSKRWNNSFTSASLKYGDVAVITVDDWGGSENWHGEDTFISRNEELVKETEGYDEAYYELTKAGYRLLHLNQFTVNNNNHVSLETTKEVMNKNITDYITLPTTLENPEDYRMEFASVDTASSGKKTSTLNVYEKLESGGEFLTTYEVNYVVDPVVTEHYYNTDNNLLSSDKTEFEYGTSFEPAPVMHREDNGILYIYKGWSDEKPGTENAQVVEGVPSSTTEEKTYYYIYEKADKFINVTLPTEVIFGTYDDSKTITSKDYTIKNNSNLVDLEVDLASFDKVKSDVKLLDKEAPAPTEKEASARLDLMMNNKSVIPGLTETTDEQELGYITRGQTSSLGISGTYFGERTDNHKVEYAMYLKFKARVDEEK